MRDGPERGVVQGPEAGVRRVRSKQRPPFSSKLRRRADQLLVANCMRCRSAVMESVARKQSMWLRTVDPLRAIEIFRSSVESAITHRSFAGIAMRAESRGKRSSECAPGKAAIDDGQLSMNAGTGTQPQAAGEGFPGE